MLAFASGLKFHEYNSCVCCSQTMFYSIRRMPHPKVVSLHAWKAAVCPTSPRSEKPLDVKVLACHNSPVMNWHVSVEISGESRCNSVIVSLLALSTKTLSACNDLSGGEEWKTAFSVFFLQLSRVESPAMNHCYLSNELRKIWKKKGLQHSKQTWTRMVVQLLCWVFAA